jgi:glycosyltransferase A (GT-A) superfamily protein (DUF2064 family)
MQAANDESTEQRGDVRECALRRVIENVELSDRMAGARVIEAVRSRLAEGSHRVIVTSADSALSADTLQHAFDALRFSRLVCAPGVDGEIALLGMSQSHDALVASIPWGTEGALEALLRAARESHLPMVILPPVSDDRGD